MHVQVAPVPTTYVDGQLWPVEHPYDRACLEDYLARIHLAAGMRGLGHRLMDWEVDELIALSPLPLTYARERLPNQEGGRG